MKLPGDPHLAPGVTQSDLDGPEPEHRNEPDKRDDAPYGSANTWPGGRRHAMHQDDHERWNASHYPGTRQLCAKCGEPTGRCEEDAMLSDAFEPLCETCCSPNDQAQPRGRTI